ncbi:MAG: AbrB/MazE/SpoVT family DNA-binding domain-containing protein [Caldilineaceae bacterium]
METRSHEQSHIGQSQFDGSYYIRIGKHGRTTLPKQIRQLLELEENTEVEIKVENGQVTLTGRLPTLEELAGSLPPLPEGMRLEEVIRQAKIEHAMGQDG